MIKFDINLYQILQLVSGTILPLIVGLVTTRVTLPGVKAVLLAALSVIVPLVSEVAQALQTGKLYDLGSALVLALGTFLVAVGTHFGLWKPTGISYRVQRVPTIARHTK